MLLHRRDELRKIMRDNGNTYTNTYHVILLTCLQLGSFIAFPPIGSGSGTVTVYAENRVNAERTLRSLNFLVCSTLTQCTLWHIAHLIHIDLQHL